MDYYFKLINIDGVFVCLLAFHMRKGLFPAKEFTSSTGNHLVFYYCRDDAALQNWLNGDWDRSPENRIDPLTVTSDGKTHHIIARHYITPTKGLPQQKVVGTLSLRDTALIDNGRKIFEIAHLGIHPEFTGQAISQAMMLTARDWQLHHGHIIHDQDVMPQNRPELGQVAPVIPPERLSGIVAKGSLGAPPDLFVNNL